LEYKTWLKNFVAGKKEVPSNDHAGTHAVHSIRTFADDHQVWEIAFTYTGRVVLRFGLLQPAGTKMKWSTWQTLHDVELP